MDAKQPPAPLGDESVAYSVSQGSACKFVSNKGTSPVTSCCSSSRALSIALSAWQQRGGCSVGHIEAGEYFSSESEGERPPSLEAPHKGPIYAHRRNQHRDEHERDPAFKGESECARKHISNRLCAREGASAGKQGSFVQCARSEQLSAVRTFECVHGVDISHGDCSHPNLTVL